MTRTVLPSVRRPRRLQQGLCRLGFAMRPSLADDIADDLFRVLVLGHIP